MLKQKGSSYEQYNETHKTYDLTRLPVGVEQIIARISSKKPLSAVRFLDAGCGTGLHLKALKDAGIGFLCGVDASEEGLKQATQKLGNGDNQVLKMGDIHQLDIAAASFDAVLYSYVVHHLTNTESALQEAYRVLDKGGQAIILTCSPEQLSLDNVWYYKYFAEAAEASMRRFLPVEDLAKLLRQIGFVCVETELVEKTYYTSESLNPCGPMSQEWRNGDSLFSYYRDKPELLQASLAALQQDIDNGSIHDHIKQVVERIETVKQGILIFAKKGEK